MKGTLFSFIIFSILTEFLIAKDREHFVVGWSRGTFHLLEKRELPPYSLWEYERFNPCNWYDLQIYLKGSLGVQFEYGVLRHEKWREDVFKKKHLTFSQNLPQYLFLNLIYKFQEISKIKLSPFIVIGAGLASAETAEFIPEPAKKAGVGMKYNLLRTRKENPLFINIKIGLFYYTPSVKKRSSHWDFQYGLEIGI